MGDLMVDGRRYIFLILFCKIQLCLFFYLDDFKKREALWDKQARNGVLAILSAALQSFLEEAKLFTGGKERFLPTCSCLPGHREMHASPAMQKASATSLSSLTGSFQKMTRHISDITQMAVSRCLNFCKSEYVIRINASTSKYSAATLAVGRTFCQLAQKHDELKGKAV